MALNFYTLYTKELKLKVRKFWGLAPTFVEVTGEKLVGEEAFCSLPPSLNRVKLYLIFDLIFTNLNLLRFHIIMEL